MAIILDADVVILGEKGRFDLKTWLGARPDEEFELSQRAQGQPTQAMNDD